MNGEKERGTGLKVLEVVIKDSIRQEYGDDSVFYRMLAGSVLTRYFEAEGHGSYAGKAQNKKRRSRFQPGKTNMEGFL